MNTSKLLLSATECREVLGLSKSLWTRLRAQGRLPQPVRIAGLLRWKRRDIERLAETGVKPSRRRSPP